MNELILLAHVPTDSVNDGFIPAARRLGLSVVLLTDAVDAHLAHFTQVGLEAYPDEIIACDVADAQAVIGVLTCRERQPVAVFSNSARLQTCAALAAEYFGLPGKDWHVTYRARNKGEMRRRLQAQGLDALWHAVVCEMTQIPDELPFPCIVKSREGGAGQHVTLARDRAALKAQCAVAWVVQPGLPLVLEQYIEGPLYRLETLGDGRELRVVGGFKVAVSPPPYFVALDARWGTGLPAAQVEAVLRIIREFGIAFGACHTEFVMSPRGPRIIEIDYCNVADYREFDAPGIDLFETVLRLHLGEPLPALARRVRAEPSRMDWSTLGAMVGVPVN